MILSLNVRTLSEFILSTKKLFHFNSTRANLPGKCLLLYYFMFESVFFDVPRYLSLINTLHK